MDRDTNDVTVAGAIVYADDPQAVIPRKCSIKVARYESNHEEPDRDHLLGTPTTIDGPARQQIDRAIEVVTALVQQVPILGPDGAFSTARYPPEALKEVIVNAVVHRDYSLSDDILISVFDDRIVVRSPGVLPGHMTLENLLSDRASRNPKIVRLLHMMPNPPNKDIGEGLNTVMSKMKEAKLSDPVFMVDGSSFVVTLGHTTLARPQEIVMQYLENHDEITNSKARELCGIRSENRMKDVFYDLRDAGKIQRHPERNGSRSSWILVPAGRLFNPDAPE